MKSSARTQLDVNQGHSENLNLSKQKYADKKMSCSYNLVHILKLFNPIFTMR
eukprot:c36022_g1_i1 orf=1-153(-)